MLPAHDAILHHIDCAQIEDRLKHLLRGLVKKLTLGEEEALIALLDDLTPDNVPTEPFTWAQLKEDFLKWSGGELPEDKDNITVYCDYARNKNWDGNTVARLLEDWYESGEMDWSPDETG